MSNIDKQALREAAVRAGGVKWQYMRATQHSKAYITDDKGSPIVNCTDGDVPAKCAGFLESANPAAVLALLDELEAVENRIAEVESQRRMAFMACNRWADKFREAEKRIAELSASHGNLREAMAGIHNTITAGGAYTPLAAILNASKRAYEESAAAAAKGE
ncbi:ead/Ea22-like family protein [Enterobacter hormaechei]